MKLPLASSIFVPLYLDKEGNLFALKYKLFSYVTAYPVSYLNGILFIIDKLETSFKKSYTCFLTFYVKMYRG